MVSFSDGSGYHHGVNVNDASNSSKSQVTVSTVLTICLTVLFFVAAVFFIFQTRVAVILTLTAALLSVALNHVVDALQKHKVRRSLAVAFVICAVILSFVRVWHLLIPSAVSQGKAVGVQ